MRKFKAIVSLVLVNCLIGLFIAPRRFFFSFLIPHHLTASTLISEIIVFKFVCMSVPHRAKHLIDSAVISANFLMKSCQWRIYRGEGGARLLLPSTPERQESVLKHSTDGWKSSHFSNLFHFWRFNRLGRLIVARKKIDLHFTSPQFIQDDESSCPLCPSSKNKV